jgi:hypothetical protein
MASTLSPEKEARRAIGRLRRALEKGVREIDSLESAIRRAEGDDFPLDEYARARASVDGLVAFLEEEERRLRDKVLMSGGLEPGRVRRASATE